MKLPIVTVPNPVLRQISQPVTILNTKIIQFIKDLEETLYSSETPGVGISAIQVGRPLRLFLSYFPENPDLPLKKWHKAKSVITAYINPVIIAHSDEIYLGDEKNDHQMEGCLSIPKVWGHVWRYRWIDLEFSPIFLSKSDQKRQPLGSPGVENRVTARFSGFPARVIQHEYDHLDGILFTDHIIGKSPIKGFKPLKEHTNHLFFEVDEAFTPIDNPAAFAKW